jgi:hypothetical protein
MAAAMVASPIQACQCSTGTWLVTIVALLPAQSSMQVPARHAVDDTHAPVVEHHHVSLRQLEQPLAEGPAAVPDAQFLLNSIGLLNTFRPS